MTWIRACPTSELPPGSGCEVLIDGEPVGLFHTTEGIRAIENTCPHQEGQLHLGEMVGESILCPIHFWRFRLDTGESDISCDYHLRTFEVQVRDGWIWIETRSSGKAECENAYDAD